MLRPSSAQRFKDSVNVSRHEHGGTRSRLSSDELTSMRRKVIGGCFSSQSLGCHYWMWELLSFVLMFFGSSTFTDTGRERDSLILKIVEKLRRFVEAMGISGLEILPVDMRWGVRDENTLDHQTWLACQKELKRCSQKSSGLFFLSLQSNKYGYTPLPKFISRQSFDSHLKSSPPSQEIRNLIAKWYFLDENKVPAVYVLRDLDRMDDKSYWDEALPKLTIYFDGVAFDDNYPDLLINRSVTEWEVKSAILYESDVCCSRTYWLHRDFLGGVPATAERHWDYYDVHGNPEKQKNLEALKKWMKSTIPSTRVTDFQDVSFESYKLGDATWSTQFKDWEHKAEEVLMGSLHDVMAMKLAWDADGAGLGVPGLEAAEMLEHSKWAAMKVMDFIGREDLVGRCLAAILEAPAAGGAARVEEASDGICCCLCVVGLSGFGKTALMAQLADSLYRYQQTQQAQLAQEDIIAGNEAEMEILRNRPVLIRFCGIGQGSATGSALLRSLCRQIHLVLGHPMVDSASLLSMSYEDLVEHFHELISHNAVVVFIDSLDQLSNENLARSELSFLRSSKTSRPHKLTRIIVSTLPDERLPGSQQWARFFGCDSRLAALNVLRVTISAAAAAVAVAATPATPAAPVGSLAAPPAAPAAPLVAVEEAAEMLKVLLARQGRRLTAGQWAFVSAQLAVEPTPLYVHLALRVVGTWSSIKQDLALAAGVKELIVQILGSAERAYGTVLTRAALGFLTFAVAGVSDSEMCDLLTLHPGVMAAVNQYNTSASLPPHVWLRLRGEIEGLITERQGGCMGWYHRQLREAAEKRYEDEKPLLHQTLARYFGNIAQAAVSAAVSAAASIAAEAGTASTAAPGVAMLSLMSQPLVRNATQQSGDDPSLEAWLPGAVINTRRCIEAGHHMVQGGMLSEAVAELCDVSGVCARAKSGVIFALLDQLTLLFQKLKQQAESSTESAAATERERVEHFLRWVRRDANSMAALPQTAVFSTCWSQPMVSQVRADCLRVLGASCWRPVGPGTHGGWLRVRAMGCGREFEPTLTILSGHSAEVSCVVFSPLADNGSGTGGRKVATGSKDKTIRIWDASTGLLLNVLEGHQDPISMVRFSADGRRVASACGDGVLNIVKDASIRVWDTVTGAVVGVLRGHSGQVTSLSFSTGGSMLASTSGSTHSYSRTKAGTVVDLGSSDDTLRLWDLTAGILLHSLEGHVGKVVSVVFSADDSKVISGSVDATLRIWDVTTGCILNVLVLSKVSTAKHMAISTDAAMVAVVTESANNVIELWSPSRETLSFFACACKDQLLVLALDKVGLVIEWNAVAAAVTGYSTQQVKFCDIFGLKMGDVESKRAIFIDYADDDAESRALATTFVVAEYRAAVKEAMEAALCGTEVASLCFYLRTQSGQEIAVVITVESTLNAFRDRVLICVGRVVDNFDSVSEGSEPSMAGLKLERRAALCGDEYGVNAVAFSDDASLLFSATRSEDNSVMIWDARAGTQRAEAGPAGDGVCYRQRGREGAGAGVFPLQHLRGHSEPVMSIAVSADLTKAMTGAGDKTAKIWDIAPAMVALDAPVASAAGKSSENAEVVGVDSGSGNATGAAGVESMVLTTTFSVAFSPDGRQLACGTDKGTIYIWDVSSGFQTMTFFGHAERVTCVVFSYDGTKVVSASEDNTVRLWDAASGLQLRVFDAHKAGVAAVAFTADDSKLVSCSEDKSVRLWEASSGEQLGSLADCSGEVFCLSVCPNGKTAVYATDDSKLWAWDFAEDDAQGSARCLLQGQQMYSVATTLHSKETLIAAGCDDGTVRILNGSSGAVLAVLQGHSDRVMGVAWSPDGRQLVSGSDDFTVRVWDISSAITSSLAEGGQEKGSALCTLENHTTGITAVGFSPDGLMVVSASWDRSILVSETACKT